MTGVIVEGDRYGVRPEHGQGIARAIQQQSENVLIVDHGSLYPALQRFEDRGFISAEWGVSEALGIGINAAIFSVMNALMFKPLPVRDPRQLVEIRQGTRRDRVKNDHVNDAVVCRSVSRSRPHMMFEAELFNELHSSRREIL